MSGLKKQISCFNQKSIALESKLNTNPYCETYQRPTHILTVEDYGRPERGSRTERRGISAGYLYFYYRL